MKKRWLAVAVSIALTIGALFLLLDWMGDMRAGIATSARAASLSLSVTAVNPNTAPNDVDTPIVIRGTGFTATLSGTEVLTAPVVYLGETALADVLWGSTTTLSATVPWGLVTGTYTMTVVNPDGISATLASAFTVTDGINMWTTGGPYGGQAVQLAIKPGYTNTILASMWGAGLFISEDAAGTWRQIHDYDWPIAFDFDAQNPGVIYFGTDGGVFRSMDSGASWEHITDDPEDIETNGFSSAYPAAHPVQAGYVYVGMGSCAGKDQEPGTGGVFFSTDYGDTWTARNTGLTDLDIQAIAINPQNPGTLLAGTFDGNVFYSNDGGLN